MAPGESREAQEQIPKGCVYNLLSTATCSRGSFRCDRKHRDRAWQGVCPFCGEDDFDSVGLKIHLTLGYCERFNCLEVGNRVY